MKIIGEQNTTVILSDENGEVLCNRETAEIIGSPYRYDYFNTEEEPLIFLCEEDYNGNLSVVRIYDTEKDKMLADNWKVIYSMCPLYHRLLCMKNPITGKYHLFNMELYGTDKDIFNEGYKNIKCIRERPDFVLTDDNGKKAWYSYPEGLVTGFQFDNIKYEDNSVVCLFIFTKGKKKAFILADDEKRRRSKYYDSIKFDYDYIYCRNGKNWDVYIEESNVIKGEHNFKLVFTVQCDSIKKIGRLVGSYSYGTKALFLIKNGKKYGLMEGTIDSNERRKTCIRPLGDMDYDGIDVLPSAENTIDENNVGILFKNGKIGLFEHDTYHFYQTAIKYDFIKMIKDKLFALYRNGICDIYSTIEDEILLSDCEKFTVYLDYIIYEKENKKGIYTLNNHTIHRDLNNYGYDDIEILNGNLFIVDVDGKKGLLHGTKTIIDPKYKSIRIIRKRNCGCVRVVFSLELESEEGDYELNFFDLNNLWDSGDRLTIPDNNIYKRIKFYDNFYITENNEGVYVSSYNGSITRVFPPNTKVFVDKVDDKNGKELDLLIVDIVDNEYYVFIKGEFIPVDKEYIPEYEYKYTSDYGEVGMIFHSESEYSEFVKKMRKLSKEDIDDIFIGLYERSPRAQEKYPSLIKK